MNIEESWRRICGIHAEPSGRITAVWFAHDRQTDTLHLYNAVEFQTEEMPIIAEGLASMGRWIPIAWERGSKSVADKLLERGCNMISEPVKEDEALADVLSREISTRIRTGRFVANARLKKLEAELKSSRRKDGKVPLKAQPYNSAMRHAVASLDWARSYKKKKANVKRKREVAIL